MKGRHIVLSILFMTWIISVMNRLAMSIAIPYIAAAYQLNPSESGLLMSLFFAGYSITQVPGGILADRFGARRVATIAMLWWSAFTAITGAAANVIQMAIVRFVFGLGEGMFPACSFKSIAVWFPKKERATANAIMLASNSIGAAIAPLAVVGIMSLWGWRAVFYSMALPGVLMALLFWIFIPDRPSDSSLVSATELVEIAENSEPVDKNPERQVAFAAILFQPNVLKYFLILLTFNISFWGFTAWLPTYLVKARGFSMTQMGAAAALPFVVGAVGVIVGGGVSDRYFRRHRRTPIVVTLLMSALLLYLTCIASSDSVLVICETLAGLFLNVFYSTFWALPMNTVPKQLMGVTGGFINMAGQIAAFISPLIIGYLVGASRGEFDHAFLFLIAALLVSCAIALTLPSNLQANQDRGDLASEC